MKTVHAVTIHHRGRDMLDVCLRSLLASVDVDLEIVVVLNGCDEELPEIVEESPRVHVVAAEAPVGFSEANNLGVAWAREHFGEPDYWYFINNDTRSEPDALALQVAALEADDAAAVAGPTLLIDWACGHLNSLGLNVTDDAWGWDEGIGVAVADYGPLPGRRRVTAVTGSAILVEAGAFRRVGGWTELYDYYFEDIDLCLKVRSAGFQVVHEPAAVVGHHVSATMTLESDHKLFLFWRNRLVLAFVHWPVRLLARLLKIAVVDEILRGPADQAPLRRRALQGALGKLPRALAARRRHRGRRDWVGMLRPRGSVPVITLPEKPAAPAPAPAETVPPGTWDAAVGLEVTAPYGRRVLVLGCAPLPFEDERMNLAPGARTWQLAGSLADDGHAVCVLAMRIPGTCEPRDRAVDRVDPGHGAGPVVFSVEAKAFREPGVAESAVAAFRPDLVVGGSSAGPALRAAQVAGERPLWIDLFGDLMAEGQARLGVHPDDDLLACREVLEVLLERGDAFSAVSDRQRFAVLGQLGLTGRLNRETLGSELVHTVPCSVTDDRQGDVGDGSPDLGDPDIGADDVVLLWSGGFNTWCDVATLVGGVEQAMAADPRLRLVVTGGAVRGHDDRSYPAFLEGVARSRFAERFLVRGELPTGRAAAYRARADLGIVTERDLAERSLGSSGRVLRWLAEGLPVVCTGLSELGSILAAAELAWVYRAGDPGDLARAVLEAAADPEAARERAERARRYALEHWSRATTTEPLRRWARQARRAPDAGVANPLSAAALAELRAELDRERARYHEVRSELGRIHQSRMWKTWMLYLSVPSILRGRWRGGSGPSGRSRE